MDPELGGHVGSGLRRVSLVHDRARSAGAGHLEEGCREVACARHRPGPVRGSLVAVGQALQPEDPSCAGLPPAGCAGAQGAVGS
eukprot:4794006-Pyramimonas_sp.AAC.1